MARVNRDRPASCALSVGVEGASAAAIASVETDDSDADGDGHSDHHGDHSMMRRLSAMWWPQSGDDNNSRKVRPTSGQLTTRRAEPFRPDTKKPLRCEAGANDHSKASVVVGVSGRSGLTALDQVRCFALALARSGSLRSHRSDTMSGPPLSSSPLPVVPVPCQSAHSLTSSCGNLLGGGNKEPPEASGLPACDRSRHPPRVFDKLPPQDTRTPPPLIRQ